MKNIIIIALFLVLFSSNLFAQNNAIQSMNVSSKENGTVIEVFSEKNIPLENVSAWYSNDWFYLTFFDSSIDFENGKDFLKGDIKDIEIQNNDESGQIAVKLAKNIESFDILDSSRLTTSFLLRYSQEASKKIISKNVDDDEIEIASSSWKPSGSNMLPILGAIIALSDISNPNTFVLGSITALLHFVLKL